MCLALLTPVVAGRDPDAEASPAAPAPRRLAPARPEVLLWVDLETTGLDERAGQVVEVAATLTDMAGEQIAPWTEAVLGVDGERVSLPARVAVMHGGAGGLLEQALTSRFTVAEADQGLRQFLADYAPAGAKCYLAGSSVHFDRGWMRAHLPLTFAALHYRQVDVSSLILAMRAAGMGELERGPIAHRARTDLEWSISAYKTALLVLRASRLAPGAAEGTT